MRPTNEEQSNLLKNHQVGSNTSSLINGESLPFVMLIIAVAIMIEASAGLYLLIWVLHLLQKLQHTHPFIGF